MSRPIWLSKFSMPLNAATRSNYRADVQASLIFSFFNVVFNQFFVPLAIQHGASHLDVGILSAAPSFGLLFSPYWASLVERGDPKRYWAIPNLIARTFVLLPAFILQPWAFVATAVAFQMLMGIQAPAYASLVTKIYPAETRGRLMGNVRVGMVLLMIPLAYLIGWWIDQAGASWPLAVGAVSGVASVLIFWRVKELNPQAPYVLDGKRAGLRDQFKLLVGNKPLALYLAATTFTGLGNMLAQPLYQIVQVDRLHLSNVDIGYARMVYFIFMLLSYFVTGWIIDRYSTEAAMMIGLVTFTVCPLLYGLSESYWSVLAASGIQGIGDAVWDIGCMAYIFKLAPGREAVVFGLHLLLSGVRGTIGPLASTGMSHTVSLHAMFLAACAFGIVGTILLANHMRHQRADRLRAPGGGFVT